MIRPLGSLFATLGLMPAGAVFAADWPPLPVRGFISGRAAQQADIARGDAIFAAVLEGRLAGKPLALTIPQYVYRSATREHGVLVQAEEVDGRTVFGVRSFRGEDWIVMEGDVQLLGTLKPQ